MVVGGRVDCARVVVDEDERRSWEEGIVLRGRVDRAREAIGVGVVKMGGREYRRVQWFDLLAVIIDTRDIEDPLKALSQSNRTNYIKPYSYTGVVDGLM